MGKFKDSSYLLRLAALFAVGLIAFIVIRAAVIPKSFGQYGPYRGKALTEITARPLSYAGHEVCEGCHPDVYELKSKSAHAHVNCESCHGPQANHADDPGTVKPQLPEVTKLCVRCHSENIAKPQGFPQMNVQEHSSGQPCNTCHKPHSPRFYGGDKK